MNEGLRRGNPTTRCPLQKSLTEKKRFVDIFHGLGLFTDDRSDGVQADRSASKFFADGLQNSPIHRVETRGIDLEPRERTIRHGLVDTAVAIDLREIAHPAQEAVGDAGRPPRASRNLARTVTV